MSTLLSREVLDALPVGGVIRIDIPQGITRWRKDRARQVGRRVWDDANIDRWQRLDQAGNDVGPQITTAALWCAYTDLPYSANVEVEK